MKLIEYTFTCILITIGALTIISCTESIPFNSELWKSPKSYEYKKEDITDRQKMLEDVLKIIKGKTKTEIINILGNGSETEYFKSEGSDLVYVLGPERSFVGIDYEWLLLWFDANGKLKKYEIITD